MTQRRWSAMRIPVLARIGGESKGAAILVVLLTSLIGCGRPLDAPSAIQVSESDSVGIAIVTVTGSVHELPVWTLSDEFAAEVSGNAAPFLSSIGEVEFLSDGRLLIEDNQSAELHLFEANGDWVRLLGGRGDGPGEFQNLTELSIIQGDTAVTYDRRLYRMTLFDPSGEVVSTVAVGREFAGEGTLVLDGWGFDSDHLLIHSMAPSDPLMADHLPRRDQRDALLFAIDGSGRARSVPQRFTGGYSIEGDGFDAGAPFGNTPIVAVGAGRVVRGSGLTYELSVQTPTLQVLRIIRWEGWAEPLTDSLLESVRDTVTSGWEELREARPELVTTLLDGLFAEELLPDTLPALGSALVDDTGRIWVARFRPQPDTWKQEDVWHVLGEDGTPLARLRLPPLTRLAAVRGNQVAVVTRDELEVEDVRVFGLVGPMARE